VAKRASCVYTQNQLNRVQFYGTTTPITIIIAFIPMQMMGVTANIMSLGGIAIAIGAMVDAAIVIVEQTHKKLEQWNAEGRKGSYKEVVITAVKEVGGPSFFALTVDRANDVVMSAIGGENVTTTIEGRERYPVNVRYLRDYCSSLDSLTRAFVMAPNGQQIPLGQIADIRMVSGRALIRDENGRLTGYVYVDLDTWRQTTSPNAAF
jgi:Cu/Ag efflux pump CusA